MMLGGSGGAPSFDSRPPGSLAPGGPVGSGDGSEAPLPPSTNVPLQRPPGQSSGKVLLIWSLLSDFVGVCFSNTYDGLDCNFLETKGNHPSQV